MISHLPGTPGADEPPPRRQLDGGCVAIRFEIDEAVGGKRLQAVEPIERRLRRGSGVGRVQEHDVECPSGRRPPSKRIGAHDLDVVRAQGADRAFEQDRDAPFPLDHDHVLRAARCGLEPERSRTSEEIETAGGGDVLAQPVEQGLAHPVRGRAQRPGHRQHPAAPAAGNDAHDASRCRAFHVGDGRAERRPDRPPRLRARDTIIGLLPIDSSTRILIREPSATVVGSRWIARMSFRVVPPRISDH